MKYFLTLVTLLVLSISASAQSTTTTLNSTDKTRYQRTDLGWPAYYDFKINSAGNFTFTSSDIEQFYLSAGRELTVNRMPGVERAVTIDGANNSVSDTYNTPLWISSGSKNAATHLNWNVPLRIARPTNPGSITGQSYGVFIENQLLPNGQGGALWYEGPNGLVWHLDGYGNTWHYLHYSSNWERGGCWWDGNESEWYCGTSAGNAGVKRQFTLVGNPVKSDDPFEFGSTVTVQGQRGFTGSCPSGQVPVFKEGIAVGCQ